MQARDPRPAVAGATTWLRRQGLQAGDRLATMLVDDHDAFALGMACALAGVVQVALPPDIRPDERDALLDDARPSRVVSSAGPGVDAPDGAVHLPVDGLATLPARDPDADWPRTRPMAYTSGTTGRRKGVHVGVHDAAWGRAVVTDEHDAFGGRHGDVHLVVSPLYHSGPFRHALVTAVLGGRVAVLPGFDVDRWRHALRTVRPTSMFCVPTHLRRLLATSDDPREDLASLDLLLHAGAPCPVPLKDALLDVAPDGSVWEFYGSTEGQFTTCPPAVARAHPGSVGTARPGRRLEVRDPDEDGVGTVWVHAPDHARWEYWDRPDATAEAWDGDAFTVGDLGRLDHAPGAEPVLHLAGRPGDLVITGGVNVYPAEVERALLSHEAVAEAVAYGVPDPEWGERLVAAVITWPDASASEDELRGHVRDLLPPARVPKHVRLVQDLPRTPTGKVRRVGLHEELERW